MAQETALRSDDLVALLASVPERINDLVSALDAARLEYRHAPAFPTLHEVVTHLCMAGVEVDGLIRRAYLDQQRELPVRSSLHPPLEPGMAEALDDHLQRFARVRRRTVDLLRGLPEDDWRREVFDPGQGALSLLEVCTQVTQHEVGHLSQLRNLMALLPEP